MTASEHGNTADLFVSNVLNGTVAAGGAAVNRGTVVRIRLRVPGDGDSLPVASRPVVIGSGFAEHTDPAALVVGPTGLTLGRLENTLYVADTASNRISAIPDASTRTRTAFTGVDLTSGGHLNSPLGLSLAPNGDVLSVNAADALILETTPAGAQVATMTLDATGTPPGSGTLFGLAVNPDGTGVYFVDDGTNTLNILHGTRRLVHRFIARGSRGRGPVEPGRKPSAGPPLCRRVSVNVPAPCLHRLVTAVSTAQFSHP